MTIKTLTYIHKLLTDEAQKTESTYRASRKLQHKYEESEAASESLKASQKEAADEFYKEYIAAKNALEDFESQEW